jgi:hypothetical protein
MVIIGSMHPQITCQSSTKLTNSQQGFYDLFLCNFISFEGRNILNNKINRQGEIITNNDGTTILQLSQLGFELCPLMLQSQALTLS